VKPITLYECRDGSRWPDVPSAERHEALLERIDGINRMIAWPRVLGATFYRHDISDYQAWRRAIVGLVKEYYPDAMKPWPEDLLLVNPQSYVGRVVSDTGGPLNDLWYRLMCTTNDGHEYEQPYFATHPLEALTCINPED
jgi:hypothetical protein